MSARLIYSTVTAVAPAAVLPVFMCFKRGRERMPDRLGFWNCRMPKSLWMHGASLGETAGLSPIAAELQSQGLQSRIFGTCTSPTGLPKLQQFCEYSRLLPFDHKIYFKLCLQAVNPGIFVSSEKDIWPNLLFYLESQNIPAILANGKLSERSFAVYQKFPSLFAAALRTFDFIFAADKQSAERFIRLGVDAGRIEVVSNTKYDQAPLQVPEQPKLFKNEARLVVFASLRPGEEALAFEAIGRSNKSGKKINFIVAPRHREKFSFFENALKDRGIKYGKRSESKEPIAENVLFLDTHGELVNMLSMADLASTGGTLADGYGGHNPLEAARFGVPVVTGVYDYNVRDVHEQLEAGNAAKYARNAEDLLAAIYLPQAELEHMGQNAKNVCNSFAGSSKIIAQKILSIIGSKQHDLGKTAGV